MTQLSNLIARGATSLGLNETASKIINQLQHGDPNHQLDVGGVVKSTAMDAVLGGGLDPTRIFRGSMRNIIEDINSLKSGIRTLDGAVDGQGNAAAPGIDFEQGRVGGITVEVYTIAAPDGGVLVITQPPASLFEKGNGSDNDGAGPLHVHKDKYDALVNKSVGEAQQEVGAAVNSIGIEGVEQKIDSIIGTIRYSYSSSDLERSDSSPTVTAPAPALA